MPLRNSWNAVSRVRLLLLIAVILSACASPTRVTLVPTISLPSPTAAEVVSTLLPAATPSGDCAYPAAGDLCPAVPPTMPAEPTAAVTEAYPSPDQGLLEEPPATSVFHDCARTPGITGCDLQAPPVPGRLAFYEGMTQRLIFLDLESGAGWQVQMESAPRGMQWSQDGERLLLDLGADNYVLYSADGRLVESFQSERLPRWQPDGSLSRDGVLRSADGWQAERITEDGSSWSLRVVDARGAEQVLPLEGAPDTLYSLRGWVPDRPSVVLQIYTAGNAAMLSGGQVALLDAQSGELSALDIFAPLDDRAFAWDPSPEHPARLAMLTGGGPEGASGLTIYDFGSDQARSLLPEGVVVGDLSWQPDGQRLVFSIVGLAAGASDPVRRVFPGPGLYQLDPQSGESSALLQAPPAALDGWPNWTGDGRALIYARALPGTTSPGVLQVRAMLPESGQDWALVEGLPVEDTVAGQVVWQQLIAFARK